MTAQAHSQITVTPSGFLGLVLDRCRNLIASSTTFQGLTSQATEGDAKHYVYPSSAPGVVQDAWSVVNFSDAEMNLVSTTTYNSTNSLSIEFCLKIHSDYVGDDTSAYAWLANQVGNIIDDIRANTRNANTDNGYLHVQEFGMAGFGFLDEDENNGEMIGYSEWIFGCRPWAG